MQACPFLQPCLLTELIINKIDHTVCLVLLCSLSSLTCTKLLPFQLMQSLWFTTAVGDTILRTLCSGIEEILIFGDHTYCQGWIQRRTLGAEAPSNLPVWAILCNNITLKITMNFGLSIVYMIANNTKHWRCTRSRYSNRAAA